jgi:hypothetical protein
MHQSLPGSDLDSPAFAKATARLRQGYGEAGYRRSVKFERNIGANLVDLTAVAAAHQKIEI